MDVRILMQISNHVFVAARFVLVPSLLSVQQSAIRRHSICVIQLLDTTSFDVT